ncbi:hypothetical protein CLF_108105 [Clonorchis sinensis]|uniref:MULE transposase domain-containing protein n=1 Tax=Clonorchis sinensis TaxID=79923 RepID=G7YHL8_CLOSI|nr:hypothetical protein CLF_108105 [Clonorchis sinensis]
MYAFVESDHFASFRKLFCLSKKIMGGHYPVKTFVMDKMTSLMRAAKAVFGCDVMLCYFHARQAIRKHPTGRVSPANGLSTHISGMVCCDDVTNNRLEDAHGRLRKLMAYFDSLAYSTREVFRHIKRFIREHEMHTSCHCDRRKITEGDSYVLNMNPVQGTIRHLFMRILLLASLLPCTENLKSSATPFVNCAF